MPQMKAIHWTKTGEAAQVFEVQSIPIPDPKPDDLLVKIEACAINPIDTKVRSGGFPAKDITGFDAAGTVTKVGAGVKGFQPGDEVYYAGVLGRPGSTAQYNLVDYRLAALKPKNLDWITSASIPLVSLTAWEMLEDHFGLQADDPTGKQAKKSILIINGAGGVGSICTQFARKVFKLGKVIVTASRPETIDHVKQMGATDVISHRESLKPQLEKIGVSDVNYIMICYNTNSYLQLAVDIAAPRGKIGSIVEVSEQLPALHTPDAFMKALSFHWEMMFARAVANVDMEAQGEILTKVAKLYDEGVLTSLVTEQDVLSVSSLIKAHENLESGKAIGKTALKVGDDIQ